MLWAQFYTFRGQVVEEGGQPLPYAIIRLPQTGFQTVSGADGRFTLNFLRDTLEIEVRRLGYRTHRETLYSADTAQVRLIRLQPQEVRLPSVVITGSGENPADILIRRAIAAKDKNRACLPAYQVETYTLYTLRWKEPPGPLLRKYLSISTEKGEVLFMAEALSRAYFSPPNKYREEILHSRIVGTRNYSILGSWILQGFDPYGERISLPDLTEAPFILPLAQDAFLYYRYRLVGEYWDDTGFFYKIAVEPRSPTSPCVEGYVVIADESYAIAGLEWAVTGKRPIRYVDTLWVQATSVPVGTCYQLGEVSFRGNFQVSLPVGALKVRGEGYAAYRKYRLLVQESRSSTGKERRSPPVSPKPEDPASSLASRQTSPVETLRVERLDFGEFVRVMPEAEKSGRSFWDSLRTAPLDSAQMAYLSYQDTLLRKRDSLARRSESRLAPSFRGLFWSRNWRTAEGRRGVRVGMVWPFFTRLEGWVVPVQIGFEKEGAGAEWEVEAFLRYGVGWQRLAPSGVVRWQQRRFPLMRLSLRGGVVVQEPTDFSQVPLLWNTFYRLAGFSTPWRGYARPLLEGEAVGYLHRTWEGGLRVGWDKRGASPEGERSYEAIRLAGFLKWQPGTRLFSTPRRTLLLPPDRVWRTEVELSAEAAHFSQGWLFSASIAPTAYLSISPLGALELRLGASWQNQVAPWADALYPATAPLYFHRYYTDWVRWPLYLSGGQWIAQGMITWLPQGGILRLLPLLRRTAWRENLSCRLLYAPEKGWHAELSFYLMDINLRLRRTGAFRPLSVGVHTGVRGLYRTGAVTLAIGNPSARSLLLKPAFP